MSKSLDAGFFEPFRGNITEWDSNGFIKAVIKSNIQFDKNVINQYFDNAELQYTREFADQSFTINFSGIGKTEEIRNILTTIAYNPIIQL